MSSLVSIFSGPAYFDEPTTATRSHQPVECSGNGLCNRRSGVCACRPGFTGTACQIKDCERSISHVACSGHGTCMSIASYYELAGLSYGSPTTAYASLGDSTWDAFNWFECVCSASLSYNNGLSDPYHIPKEPRGIVSGVPTYSRPLPGWGNWDCSKKNCPRGDDTTKRNNGGGELEIQRVTCIIPNINASRSFRLKLYGHLTEKIYINYNAAQIQAAIEMHPAIGNVSVWFPLAENNQTNNIYTACSSTASWRTGKGGFLVKFLTEFGDVPLMTEIADSKSSANITVTEYQKGTNANLECGGSSLGYCERETGKCICNKHQISSNGSNFPGAVGDCSYSAPEPWPTDATTVFNSIGELD